MNPTVSVIIPCYNSAGTLAEAVESVCRQTFPDWEVLIVDDGSRDGSAGRFRRTDDRVFYIHQRNGGPEVARNTGIRFARARYVAFLDADDVWASHKLARQVELLEAHPDVWMVCAETERFENHWQPPADDGPARWVELTLPEVYIRNPVSTSSVVVRADRLRQVGLFRVGIRSEDWDLWMRIAREGRILKILQPLSGHRVHPFNRNRNVEKELPWALRVVNDNCDALPSRPEYRRLRRQSLALVYLSRSRDYHLRGALGKAWELLGRSFRCWPFAFPRIAHLPRLVRVRYGLRLLRDGVRGRFSRTEGGRPADSSG